MSVKDKFKKLVSGKKRFLMIFGVCCLVMGVAFAFLKKSKAPKVATAPESTEVKKSEEMMESKKAPKGVISKVHHSVHQFSEKLKELRTADVENKRLRYENLNLRRWVEELQLNCTSQKTKKHVNHLGIQLDEETGTHLGRVLSGIKYRPPVHLLPEQLYTLGVSYFKAGDFERSAVIFTYLTGVESFEDFKLPKNFLMAGVAWYKVDHVKLAHYYLDKVLAFQEEKDSMKAQAQARLWKALAAKRLNRENKSQHWLRQLVGNHPHSVEASWVNTNKLMRVPANEK